MSLSLVTLRAISTILLVPGMAAYAATAPMSPSPPPNWHVNFEHRGAIEGSNLESSPFSIGGRLYLMASQMGNFFPDNKCHSYFCILDMATGNPVSCPNASTDFAFQSAVTSVDNSRVWVFGTARNRCTQCPNFGCGPCDEATGACFVGAWSSAGPSGPNGEWAWDGPFHAVDLPPNVTAYNVGVGVLPPGTPAPPGLPAHQAFMALEGRPDGSPGNLVAINTGADGNLGANWGCSTPRPTLWDPRSRSVRPAAARLRATQTVITI